MPYHEIRRMIVEVDEEQLTEPMIQVQQILHKMVKMFEGTNFQTLCEHLDGISVKANLMKANYTYGMAA